MKKTYIIANQGKGTLNNVPPENIIQIGATELQEVIYQLNIDSTTNIDNIMSYNGRNVLINNGTSNINVKLTSGLQPNFVSTIIKEGTGKITIVADTGVTLKVMDDLSVLDGAPGSRAMISRSGNTFYLYITNY